MVSDTSMLPLSCIRAIHRLILVLFTGSKRLSAMRSALHVVTEKLGKHLPLGMIEGACAYHFKCSLQ